MGFPPRVGAQVKLHPLLERKQCGVHPTDEGIDPRWQWKINRIRQKWSERVDHARTLANTAQNQQRMCPECRALVDRGADQCPLCGSPMHSVARGVVGRAAELSLPSRGLITYLLTLVNGLLFLLTLDRKSHV